MTPVVLYRVTNQGPGVPADAPVVLLLGSLGSTVKMWQPQVERLSAAYRVVRVDTRGHGRSPVPDGPYDIDDLVDDSHPRAPVRRLAPVETLRPDRDRTNQVAGTTRPSASRRRPVRCAERTSPGSGRGPPRRIRGIASGAHVSSPSTPCA